MFDRVPDTLCALFKIIFVILYLEFLRNSLLFKESENVSYICNNVSKCVYKHDLMVTCVLKVTLHFKENQAMLYFDL